MPAPYPVTFTTFARRDGAFVAAFAARPCYTPGQLAVEVIRCMMPHALSATQYDIHVALNTPDNDRPRVGYFTWNRRAHVGDARFVADIRTWLDTAQ